MTELALKAQIIDIENEYKTKIDNIKNLAEKVSKLNKDCYTGNRVGTGYAHLTIGAFSLCEHSVKQNLTSSAWRHTYDALNMDFLMDAESKKSFKRFAELEAKTFNLELARNYFEPFALNARHYILKSLAEVFCKLDPFYKSHSKVKIGVKGLPKRVILNQNSDFASLREEQITEIVKVIYNCKGLGHVNREDITALIKNLECKKIGISLKIYEKTTHIYFDKANLLLINKALAEFYGDVLPDEACEKPTKKQQSTSISKDLQYYPTPKKAVKMLLNFNLQGKLILEPSCGCGMIMKGVVDETGDASLIHGIEFDKSRVDKARRAGFRVLQANFLEVKPTEIYDVVLMNPPFYGKHYAKHVLHAMKFLKEGGVLRAILPVTAKTDHKLLDGMGQWSDLPFGSFIESGTNINTVIFSYNNKKTTL